MWLNQWQHDKASPYAKPGPSPLFSEDNSTEIGWTAAMSETSAIVTGMLCIMHPDLYRAGCDAMVSLLATRRDLHNIINRWGTSFTVATVISNCSTPPYRNTKSLMEYFDILTSVGTFSKAFMEFDGIELQVRIVSETVIGLCGWVLRHVVKECGKDRIFYGWYMWSAVHASQKVRLALWMTQEVYRRFIQDFKSWLGRDEYSLNM